MQVSKNLLMPSKSHFYVIPEKWQSIHFYFLNRWIAEILKYPLYSFWYPKSIKYLHSKAQGSAKGS